MNNRERINTKENSFELAWLAKKMSVATQKELAARIRAKRTFREYPLPDLITNYRNKIDF